MLKLFFYHLFIRIIQRTRVTDHVHGQNICHRRRFEPRMWCARMMRAYARGHSELRDLVSPPPPVLALSDPAGARVSTEATEASRTASVRDVTSGSGDAVTILKPELMVRNLVNAIFLFVSSFF